MTFLPISKQVSYLIVDEMHHEHPELIKDQYWDEVFPSELPYTIAAENYREKVPEPSTAKIDVTQKEAEYIIPASLKSEEPDVSHTLIFLFNSVAPRW